MAIAAISSSKLVLLLPTEMWWENSSEWIPAPVFPSIFYNDPKAMKILTTIYNKLWDSIDNLPDE